MKKVLYVTVLALASSAIGAAPRMLAQSPDQSTITIKDPAEYNAYNSAISQPTPQAKESAIESFLQQYPNSVVKLQMLEVLMGAYQQTGNTDKAVATARRVLQVDPHDLRALALSAYVLRSEAGQKTNPAEAQPLLDEAAKDAQAGLAAPPPTGPDAANFDKMKTAVTPLFYGAIAADDLGKKDYAGAIQNFQAELKAMPTAQQTTGTGIQDTYLLGTAYAQETPQDLINAVWYLARAAAYAPEPFKDEIQKAAQYWYKKYHGVPDGLDQVQAQAKASLMPPAGFTIAPAPPPPSPQELAHTAVTSTPDLKTMALTDKEFVLSNGTPDDAGKVWDTMKGLTTKVPGKVISATPDSIQVAVSDDAQQSNKADFTINMKKPLKTPPAVGSMANFIATFDSYTQNPPMIIMKDGEAPAAAKPRAVHHATHRHTTPQ
ncbi:MAG: tetratricopeptide repeat protein [Acidobacteriaceae bacterium]